MADSVDATIHGNDATDASTNCDKKDAAEESQEYEPFIEEADLVHFDDSKKTTPENGRKSTRNSRAIRRTTSNYDLHMVIGDSEDSESSDEVSDDSSFDVNKSEDDDDDDDAEGSISVHSYVDDESDQQSTEALINKLPNETPKKRRLKKKSGEPIDETPTNGVKRARSEDGLLDDDLEDEPSPKKQRVE